MQKIILFYTFAPLTDPQAVKLWQRASCSRFNLHGRILLSRHGINGTLGGDIDDLKAYVKDLKSFDRFKSTAIKWSDGGRDNFPRLSVKVRDEIVTFGAADEIEVDARGVVGAGTHLKPSEVHALVAKRGSDVVFFDGRNAYEAAVGRFKNAVVPAAQTSRDFLDELASDKYDAIKDKPVVTYCTGGIRCEVLSALMKKRGFKEVYQIDGGIVKYGETYKDTGLWEGSLYLFDQRMGLKFSEQAVDIGTCVHCQGKTSQYMNCENKLCNRLMLVCDGCENRANCPACTAAVTIL